MSEYIEYAVEQIKLGNNVEFEHYERQGGTKFVMVKVNGEYMLDFQLKELGE